MRREESFQTGATTKLVNHKWRPRKWIGCEEIAYGFMTVWNISERQRKENQEKQQERLTLKVDVSNDQLKMLVICNIAKETIKNIGR